MHSLENMTIWISCTLGLKCLYSRPKILTFGVRNTNSDWSSSKHQTGRSLGETAITCQISCRSVHWCDLCARGRNHTGKKKGNDINLHWQTGSSPRPPTLRQRYVVLHAGWSSGGIVLSFKFRQNLMNRFRDVVVEICEWLI